MKRERERENRSNASPDQGIPAKHFRRAREIMIPFSECFVFDRSAAMNSPENVGPQRETRVQIRLRCQLTNPVERLSNCDCGSSCWRRYVRETRSEGRNVGRRRSTLVSHAKEKLVGRFQRCVCRDESWWVIHVAVKASCWSALERQLKGHDKTENVGFPALEYGWYVE
jgi:hypothetical protein